MDRWTVLLYYVDRRNESQERKEVIDMATRTVHYYSASSCKILCEHESRPAWEYRRYDLTNQIPRVTCATCRSKLASRERKRAPVSRADLQRLQSRFRGAA